MRGSGVSNSATIAKLPALRRLLEPLLATRAVLYAGRKYICPCCGLGLRAFTRGGASFRMRDCGYCPRCNSKARHRRIWLFLEQKTNLFAGPLRVLDISPKYSFSRRFSAMPNLEYVAVDLLKRLNISARMDLTATALRSDTFDAVLCSHVLEHIVEDRAAMREIYRVLKPGGWALVSAPIRLDQATFEDPTIVDPKARQRAFGETEHVRFYGRDLRHRLEACGFKVQLDLGRDVDQHSRLRYGLRDDENIFYCVKGLHSGQ